MPRDFFFLSCSFIVQLGIKPFKNLLHRFVTLCYLLVQKLLTDSLKIFYLLKSKVNIVVHGTNVIDKMIAF